MEKIDAFFVFLLIIAIIMAPLQSTGYATAGGPNAPGIQGLMDYGLGSAITFNGMAVIEAIGPYGQSYSFRTPEGEFFPIYMQYNSSSFDNVRFQMMHTGEDTVSASFLCYDVYFTGKRGSNVSFVVADQPYHEQTFEYVTSGQTVSPVCPGKRRQAMHQDGPRNGLEVGLAHLQNLLIGAGNFIGGFLGFEEAPYVDVTTKHEISAALVYAEGFTDGEKTSTAYGMVLGGSDLPASEGLDDEPVDNPEDVSFDPVESSPQQDISFDPVESSPQQDI